MSEFSNIFTPLLFIKGNEFNMLEISLNGNDIEIRGLDVCLCSKFIRDKGTEEICGKKCKKGSTYCDDCLNKESLQRYVNVK